MKLQAGELVVVCSQRIGTVVHKLPPEGPKKGELYQPDTNTRVFGDCVAMAVTASEDDDKYVMLLFSKQSLVGFVYDAFVRKLSDEYVMLWRHRHDI